MSHLCTFSITFKSTQGCRGKAEKWKDKKRKMKWMRKWWQSLFILYATLDNVDYYVKYVNLYSTQIHTQKSFSWSPKWAFRDWVETINFESFLDRIFIFFLLIIWYDFLVSISSLHILHFFQKYFNVHLAKQRA